MQRPPAVSRPAWMLALSGIAGRGGGPRRSPVEIIATMGSYVTRTPAAGVSGLRAGPFGRWADGVTALPLPAGCWGFLGRASVPYVNRINRTIHQGAAARGLPVAEISAHFLPPWAGKFASDSFHPSQDGYRDWSRALLTVIARAGARTGDRPA